MDNNNSRKGLGMKFNTVLALGLGVWFLNVGAGEVGTRTSEIRITNNTGYDIKVNVGRGAASGGGTNWYEIDKIAAGEKKKLLALSRPPSQVVKGLLFAYTTDTFGYPTTSRSLEKLIDPAKLTKLTNEDLVITIGPYSYGTGWPLEYTWKARKGEAGAGW